MTALTYIVCILVLTVAGGLLGSCSYYIGYKQGYRDGQEDKV